MSRSLDPRQLIDAGHLAEAASVLEASGQHARAADLYEQLWDFPKAARAARASGDQARTLTNLLRARETAASEQLVMEVLEATPAQAQACALACEARGAWSLAGRLYQGGSDLARAGRCFEKAGLAQDAARCFEACGEHSRALELYRDSLEELESSRGLGVLLFRLDRLEEALPPLQRTWRQEGWEDGICGRAIAAALSRLGYDSGARQALRLMRRSSPDLELCDCLEDPELTLLQNASEQRSILAGRYRLDRLIGSGGMGRVYLATDTLSSRPVAVKIFSPPGGSSGRDAFLRFIEEARITGQLDHPNIVSLLDFNESMGFMVLELMDGGTLTDRLHPSLEPSTCRSVILQILTGLQAAHQRGIVHRDIKPSNIFFSASGVAKLGDFGVAHLQDSGKTRTGTFLGSLAFMAPEQILGDPITFATDFYALGVTLFLMLTGQLPFTHPDLVGKHLKAEPPAPSSLVPGLPWAWDMLVLKCLAKAPEDRFDSLARLRRDLDRAPAADGLKLLEGSSADQEHTKDAANARFSIEATITRYDDVEILAARDNELGRAVMLVRAADGPGRDSLLGLLRTAACSGVGSLQRVLSMDPDSGQVVLELPIGEPVSPLSDLPDRLHLAEQLGLALSPLHKVGFAHGGVGPGRIFLRGNQVVLDLSPAIGSGDHISPKKDVLAALDLLDLHPDPPPADGTVLAAWAQEQLEEWALAAGQERHRSLVDEALETAPPGVDRG